MSNDHSKLEGWRMGVADDDRTQSAKTKADPEGRRPPTEEEWAGASNQPLSSAEYPYFSEKWENIAEWYERKEAEEALKRPLSPESAHLLEAASSAQERASALMAESVETAETLQVKGRRRRRQIPRYSDRSDSDYEEDVLYALEQLPREVEWAYWTVENGCTEPALRLLHHLAERDARECAECAEWVLMLNPGRLDRSHARWCDLRWRPDEKGRAYRDFGLFGFSYWLWGETRTPPMVRSSRALELERNAKARDRAKELLEELARRVGCGVDELADFPRGKPKAQDARRHDELAVVVDQALDEGVTQQYVGDILGKPPMTVSRLKQRAKRLIDTKTL